MKSFGLNNKCGPSCESDDDHQWNALSEDSKVNDSYEFPSIIDAEAISQQSSKQSMPRLKKHKQLKRTLSRKTNKTRISKDKLKISQVDSILVCGESSELHSKTDNEPNDNVHSVDHDCNFDENKNQAHNSWCNS